MDPLSLIVTALALGAAAGLKPAAEQAIKDGYAGVKALIQRQYAGVNVAGLEQKPESNLQQGAVKEQLTDAGADQDAALLDQAKALLDLIKNKAPETAASLGVDLAEIEAAYLNIKKVQAAGTGVKVRQAKFSGGIDIGEVNAGVKADDSPNP